MFFKDRKQKQLALKELIRKTELINYVVVNGKKQHIQIIEM